MMIFTVIFLTSQTYVMMTGTILSVTVCYVYKGQANLHSLHTLSCSTAIARFHNMPLPPSQPPSILPLLPSTFTKVSRTASTFLPPSATKFASVAIYLQHAYLRRLLLRQPLSCACFAAHGANFPCRALKPPTTAKLAAPALRSM
ncbi:hypothetical protein NPIL_118911 [Nephila pilipes]|uniref:Uncharacterized protein n=1 Tax=Nephila pilipes TaxID=299642 RepID=A0A8X6UF70_NEPPI|nr:hypothetical protein NPIL_118911 [Nephila pilipes]